MLETSNFTPNTDWGECHDVAFLALLEGPSPAPRALPPQTDFELPRWMWSAMMAAYTVFFIGLALATAHSTAAIFALVVSIGYAAMYFGTARVLANVRPGDPDGAFARGLAPLATWTGPMSRPAVAAQVLVVPACLALFGTAFAIIAAILT